MSRPGQLGPGRSLCSIRTVEIVQVSVGSFCGLLLLRRTREYSGICTPLRSSLVRPCRHPAGTFEGTSTLAIYRHPMGASIQIRDGAIAETPLEKKRRGYTALICGVLSRKSRHPASAARVRGKLGFAQSLVFGKLGRAMLHELSLRQYPLSGGPMFPLSGELGGTLLRWGNWIPTSTPTNSCNAPTPLL